MKPESLFKVWQANRYIGSSRPLLITTADTTGSQPLVEYFLISSIAQHPVVHRSAHYSLRLPPGFSADDFPELVTIGAMLDAELIRAQDDFEQMIRGLGAELHREVFGERFVLEFRAAPDNFLVQYALLDMFSAELAEVFRLTRNVSLSEHARLLRRLPKIIRADERGRGGEVA